MRGRDAPGPGVRPAKAEALSGPAPDLSPLLTPEPAAAAARTAYGCPCGWARSAGAAGTRARAAGPGSPEGRRSQGAERSGAGRGSETESLVTCGPGQGVSQNTSQSSASTTQDGRHVATQVT